MNSIERIPVELKAKVESEAAFDTLHVTTEDKLEIGADVEAQLAALTARNGKVGAGLIIGQPVPVQPPPNVMGPELMVRIGMTVLENPTINRDATANGTGITARQWALLIMQTVHQWIIEGLVTAIYPDPESPWSVSGDFERKGYQALDLFFLCAMPLQPIAQCQTPTITENALAVTLTGAAGETIYYTTDGSFPGSATDATVYSGPFTVVSGTTVRWAAYKAGKRGSDVGEAVIS